MSLRAVMTPLLTLLLFTGGELPAQSGTDRDSSAHPPGARTDSTDQFRISPVDEQLNGTEDDGEIELPPDDSSPDPASPPWRIRWRTRASEKIQTGRGYSDGAYRGSKVKLYNRLTMTKGGWLSAGVLTEKDPGEKGIADHISASLTIGGKGDRFGVVLGDFRIRAGQGLIFSSGRSVGKGADVITPPTQTGWGISGSPTADEFHYFRGIAGRVSLPSFSLATFTSRRVHSASVAADGAIGSLDESGYHRTASEIRNRGWVEQKSWGFLTRIEPGEIFSLGVNVLSSTLSPRGRGDDPGSGIQVVERIASIDLMLKKPVMIYGELARRGGTLSGIAAALFTPAPALSVVLSGRAYPVYDGFVPASGFGDRAGARNEQGFYIGIDVQPDPLLSFHAYLDVFSSPRPSREVVFPRRGVDGLLGVTVWKGRDFELGARFRRRDAEKKNASFEEGTLRVQGNIPSAEDRWRLEAVWRVGSRLQAMTRVDFSRVSPDGSSVAGSVDHGMMIMADVGSEPIRNLRVKFRAILFATDSYASRLYETESDLPGSLINGVVYGQGARWYVLLSWKPLSQARLSVRFSRLIMGGRKTIGSGNEEISGNVEERAGVQLDLEF